MLNSGMRESNSEIIPIENTTLYTFLIILRFIYTDEATVTGHNAVDLLEAANYFKCDRLKCMCEDTLKFNIEIENASYLLRVADRYDAKQLRGVCFEYILSNFKDVIKTTTFKELDRDLCVALTTESINRLAKLT